MRSYIILFFSVILFSEQAIAQNGFADFGKKALEAAKTEGAQKGKEEINKGVIKKVNDTLLSEGRKNQCTFKTASDQFESGCEEKSKRLANILIEMKKILTSNNMTGYNFVVYGHTDTVGNAQSNKELSKKRASAVMKELIKNGISSDEIEAVGMGAEKPLVKPDNTEAKRAKNRRYEVQVKI